MKTIVYKIMHDNLAGPFGGSMYRGLSFTNKEAAQYYIDNFVKDKEYCRIVEDSFVNYQSIEELIKERPELEIERKKIMIYNLQKAVKLPFNLSMDIGSHINNVGELSLKELGEIVSSFEFQMKMMDDKKIELYKEAEKPLKVSYASCGYFYHILVSFEMYDQLKALYDNTNAKIEEILAEIKKDKNNLNDRNNLDEDEYSL